MGSPKTKDDEMVVPEEGHHDEHEASTVVIDINQFRKELDSAKKQAADEIPVDIEFSAHTTKINDDLPLPPIAPTENHEAPESKLSLEAIEVEESDEEANLSLSEEPLIKTILFDFKSSKLEELHQGYQSDSFEFQVINDLTELNKEIKANNELIIIFYYNQSPKAINTLMKQLNSKFSHIKTMIIADNLSDKKAEAHRQTTSGAQTYLSTPQSFEEVESKLSLTFG